MISSVIQVRARIQRSEVARGSLFSDLAYSNLNPSSAKRRLYCSAGPVDVGWMAKISPHPGPLPREREIFGPGRLTREWESCRPGRRPRVRGSFRPGRLQRDCGYCHPGCLQRERESSCPGHLSKERIFFRPGCLQRVRGSCHPGRLSREGGSLRLSSGVMQQTERPRMLRGTMRRSQAKGKEFRKGLRGGAA